MPRHVPVADAGLVLDLDDVDVLPPADAHAFRGEARDLEPLGAPALAEALEAEALLVEVEALAGDDAADAGVEARRRR